MYIYIYIYIYISVSVCMCLCICVHTVKLIETEVIPNRVKYALHMAMYTSVLLVYFFLS